MKWDMGGCGAVLGAAQALAVLKPAGVTVSSLPSSSKMCVDRLAERQGLQRLDGPMPSIAPSACSCLEYLTLVLCLRLAGRRF